LADEFGDRLAMVRYHVSWPSSSDPFYVYNRTENTGRNGYYGNNYTPHFYIDGNIDAGYTYSAYRTRIVNELNVAAPLDIQIEGDFDTSTRNGQLRITVAATEQFSNTNLKLRIALIESDLHWNAPNGTPIHDETMRDLIPSPTGASIAIQNGQIVQLTQAFTCPSQLNWQNCEIVVFVQSDTGRRVLQGAKRSLSSMVYTMSQFDIIAPANQDTIGNTNPRFVWTSSADPDSSFPIGYRVHVSRSPGFTNSIISNPLTDTTWDCTVALPQDTLMYWKVVAENGHAPLRMSDHIYTLFVHQSAGCAYLPGDLNGSGNSNGVDVTFAVSYFKGGMAPPDTCDCRPDVPIYPFYGAGDINGNCLFNGVDISFYIGYLLGGPGFIACPSCLPLSR
jgi:hypothetical protein